MKKCFKCGKDKNLFDFYEYSKMADGHLKKCKRCTIKDVLAYRQVNLKKIHTDDGNSKSEAQSTKF